MDWSCGLSSRVPSLQVQSSVLQKRPLKTSIPSCVIAGHAPGPQKQVILYPSASGQDSTQMCVYGSSGLLPLPPPCAHHISHLAVAQQGSCYAQ
jgi:hypothetical protein